MLVKTILVFLLGMAAIGMIGNALFPGALSRSAKRRIAARKTKTCKTCGRHLIGTSDCDCGKA